MRDRRTRISRREAHPRAAARCRIARARRGSRYQRARSSRSSTRTRSFYPDGSTAPSARSPTDENLVCLSGPFIYYDLPFAARALVQFFYVGTYLVYLVNNFIIRETSVIQGGTEIVRRDALAKIGGHDVNLTFYGDDADLARRLSKVGGVRFSFEFAMRSSGRRLAKEGTFTMGWRYAMNYFLGHAVQ